MLFPPNRIFLPTLCAITVFQHTTLHYFTDLSSLHVLFSFSHFIFTLSVAFFTLQGLALVTVAALPSNATINQGIKWATEHLLLNNNASQRPLITLPLKTEPTSAQSQQHN